MSTKHVAIFAVLTVLAAPWAGGASRSFAADPALDKYYNANALVRRGLYPLAAKEYEAFLSAHRNHAKAPKAKWGLAICYYSMGKMEQAARLFQELAGHKDIDDQEQLHNLWGSALQELDKLPESVKAFAWTVKNGKRPDRKADALVGLTQGYFLQKSWAEAVAASDQMLKLAPTSRFADLVRYQGAMARLNLKAHAEAAKAFLALARVTKDAELAHESVFQAAECQMARNKPDDAARLYLQAATAKTGKFSETSLLNVGLLQFRAAKYKEAIETFRSFLKRYPQTAMADDANLYMGRSFLELKKYNEAIRQFDGVLRGLKDPRRGGRKRPKRGSAKPLVVSKSSAGAQATLWLVRTYAAQGKLADVVRLLKPVAGAYRDDPAAPELYYELARAQMASEAFAEAAGSFAQSERGQAPLPEESLRLRGFCLLRAKQYSQALGLCDQFLAKFPRSKRTGEVQFLKGECLMALKRVPDAMPVFDAARKAGLDADKARQTHLRVAQAWYYQKEWAKCLAALKPLLDAEGPDPIDPLAEARAKGRKKPKKPRPSTGTKLYHQIWFMAGDCHVRLKQWDQAIAALGTFLKLHGSEQNAFVARYNMALAYQALKKPAEATAVLLPFAQARTDTPEARKLRDSALLDLGRLQFQAEDYRAAQNTLQHVAGHPDAIYYLAWSAMKLGDSAAAARYFGQMSKYPGHAFATDSALQRSVLLYRAGKYPQAEATLTALLKTMPRNARTEHHTEAMFYLGLCRARQKSYDKAVECFREVSRKGQGKLRGPETQYWWAWCEKQRGQTRQAESLYEAFRQSYPQDKLFAPATLELAELRFQRYQEADRTRPAKPDRPKRQPKGSPSDYAGLVTMLTPLLAKDSKTPATGEIRSRMLYLLGWCQFRLEDWGRSARAFETLIDEEEAAAKRDRRRQPSPLLASACFQAGEARRRMKEFGPAKELFAKAARLRGSVGQEDQDDMLLRLAQLQAINNQWPQSLRTAQSLLQQFPKSKLRSEATFSVAWAYENQKKYREALQYYREIVKLGAVDQLTARAQFQIGECYFAQRQYDQAIAEFNLVMTKYGFDRWSSLALLGMGRSFQAQGKAVQARAYFDDVILKYPKTTAAELAGNLLKKIK